MYPSVPCLPFHLQPLVVGADFLLAARLDNGKFASRGQVLDQGGRVNHRFLSQATNAMVVLTVTGSFGSAGGAAAACSCAVDPLAYLTYQAATYPCLPAASWTLSHWPVTPTFSDRLLWRLQADEFFCRRNPADQGVICNGGRVRKASSSVGRSSIAPGGTGTCEAGDASDTEVVEEGETGAGAAGGGAGCWSFLSERYQAAAYPCCLPESCTWSHCPCCPSLAFVPASSSRLNSSEPAIIRFQR